MDSMSNNIGAYIKNAAGAAPAASAAGAFDGPWIDRLGYQSCSLAAQAGAATGSPSAFTLNSKLQDADDDSGTNAADLDGAAITAVAVADTIGSVSVDLGSARRWIRAVDTVAFTGGTSPTLGHSSSIVLGGAQELPAA